MEQEQWEALVQEFQSGLSRILITTDLLSRSINFQQVSFVINYDLPANRENYIHRVGRGGDSEHKGIIINFATTEDVGTLRGIEGASSSCRVIAVSTIAQFRILQHPD